MKKWIYILLLHSLTLSSQPHSLIGFRGLIFTPAIGEFPKDGKFGFGYRNIQTPYTFINWSDKTNENHIFFSSLVLIPNMELTAAVTLAPGSEGNDGTDTYKDLALFIHILLLKEKK